MEKVHNRRTTATHKDRTFRKSSTTGQVQDNFNQVQIKFNQVPRTCNKPTCYVMILSCRGISYGIAIFLMTSWQLHHWIIVVPYFKLLTTRSNQVQSIARTSQKQSSEKLSTTWTAKPWQLWKLLHTSSNESICVQLHASDIKLLTNENSWHQIQKQWNEHHMNWNHKTWRIQNCCNCQTPTKPMHSFCKIVGRLLQTELDPLTTVPYTASASSLVLTASVVPRTASALKNVNNKQ